MGDGAESTASAKAVIFNYKGFANYLGHIQLALYSLSVIFGLLTAIPLGSLLRAFDGRCVLFAELVWGNKVIWPWRELSCDFVLYFTIAGPIGYAALIALFTAVLILPRYTKENKDKVGDVMDFNKNFILRGFNPVFTGVNCLLAFLQLCAAGIVTGGTNVFCVELLESMKEEGVELSGCYDAQSRVRWDRITVEGGRSDGVRGQNFYTLLVMTCVCSWFLFVVWALLALLNIVRRCSCTCATAEEKQKPDKLARLAASRGTMTPGGMNA